VHRTRPCMDRVTCSESLTLVSLSFLGLIGRSQARSDDLKVKPMQGGPSQGLSAGRNTSGLKLEPVMFTARPPGMAAPEEESIQFTRTHWTPLFSKAPPLPPPTGSEATVIPGLPPRGGRGCSTAPLVSVAGSPPPVSTVGLDSGWAPPPPEQAVRARRSVSVRTLRPALGFDLDINVDIRTPMHEEDVGLRPPSVAVRGTAMPVLPRRMPAETNHSRGLRATCRRRPSTRSCAAQVVRRS
jgi:hypothetical protein